MAAHKGDDVLNRSLAHYEAALDSDYVAARSELCELLSLDPATAASLIVEAVRATPAFAPLLDSGNGKMTPASSFKDRLAPC